jgi:hypothetical protein
MIFFFPTKAQRNTALLEINFTMFYSLCGLVGDITFKQFFYST